MKEVKFTLIIRLMIY